MKLQNMFFIMLLLVGLADSNFVYSGQYTGTIKPMVVSTMHFGSNASFNTPIKYVVKEGTFIKPEVVDSRGKIVQKGTVLAMLDVTYWKAMADAYKSEIISRKQDVITARENYARNQRLVQSRSVSVEQFQQLKAAYYDAINNLNNAKFSLLETQQVIKAYTLKAPFEGVVDKVFITHGLASGIPQVVQVTQLNPVKVCLKMDRDKANKIKSYTKISVTGQFNDEPKEIIYGSGMLTENGISFLLFNEKVYGKFTGYKGKKVPIVTEYLPASNFCDDINSESVGIPFDCFFGENDKSFIWKLNSIENGFFKVQKIYVDKKSTEHISSIGEIIAIPKSKGLKENDNLLTGYPKGLKDGDIVFCTTQRYKFMPDDQVQVIIDIDDPIHNNANSYKK